MASISVEDETLGTKHKKYNQLVKDAISKGETVGKEFIIEKNDLNNLMKIDIAAHNKDIHFIINVLKSGDMLYVSRALKQSQWLVDSEYADIINLKYLNDTLLPELTTKVNIKLMKFIKKNITDEARAEEFYKDENNIKSAIQLLKKCSLPFIESNIGKHIRDLSILDFTEFCKKSIILFEKSFKDDCDDLFGPYRFNRFQAAIFLLETDTEKYLDTLEKVPYGGVKQLNARATNLIMKKVYEIVMNKIEIYLHFLHIPTFVKYLKPEEIVDILYKYANDDYFVKKHRSLLFRSEIMEHFIKKIPQPQRFEFVKQIFIDDVKDLSDFPRKDVDEKTLIPGTIKYAQNKIFEIVAFFLRSYEWYKFAPFDIAFLEIKKLLNTPAFNSPTVYHNFRKVASPSEAKYRMTIFFIHNIIRDNVDNIKTVLNFYNNQEKSENLPSFNKDIINNLMSATKVYKYDEQTWQEFNSILKCGYIYEDPLSSSPSEIEAILLYNIINDKPVPEIIVKKMASYPGCLKNFKNRLDIDQREKIFSFLYTNLKQRIENQEIEDEGTLQEAMDLIIQLLDLLKDWDKSMSHYPFAISKIREIIKINNDNPWKKDLRPLYNRNRMLRKFMFEESIILHPTQDACINSLKHGPVLLKHNQKHIETLLYHGNISFKQFNKKLRVYWNDNLAAYWVRDYLSKIEKPGNQTETVRGLCMLLSRDELLDILTKYAPITPKIDRRESDNVILRLQIAFAKNMHIARPQPSPDAVLMYAKGGYIKYAIPSLLAIYCNLSPNNSHQHIEKLYFAPISLQKHGLRFAFQNFSQNKLEDYLTKCWKEKKNKSIRSLIFEYVFKQICTETKSDNVEKWWKLLDIFIDSLTLREDPKVYKLLQQTHEVSLKIRPVFLIKNYRIQKKLYNETKNEEFLQNAETLEFRTLEVMKQIDPTFMEEIINNYVENRFFIYEEYLNVPTMYCIITSYVLSGQSKQILRERYDKIIVPIMKRSLEMWTEKKNGVYYMRKKFSDVLDSFCSSLKVDYGDETLEVPTDIFGSILEKLQSLPVTDNYVILTMWKLTVKITELIQTHKKESWDAFCIEITTVFCNICLEVLKEDVKKHVPVHILFPEVMNKIFEHFFNETVKLNILEKLLIDQECHQAYIVVTKLVPFSVNQRELWDKIEHIRDIIKQHPSLEVKMHYNNRFSQ